MKTGFFFEKNVDPELINDFVSRNNLSLSGIWLNIDSLKNDNDFTLSGEDELIVKSELIFLFLNSSNCFRIATKALKRGVHIFIASLSELSLKELNSLNELAREIGSRVGFGGSGQNLIKNQELSNYSFIMQMVRDSGLDVSNKSFRRMLIFDIASFVRFKHCGIKKVKVNAMPLFTKSPMALCLRFEFDNSSIINYTLSRLDAPLKCNFRLFAEEKGYYSDIPTNNILFNDDLFLNVALTFKDNLFIESVENFLVELKCKLPASFGIDKAVETMSYMKVIEDRLLSINK